MIRFKIQDPDSPGMDVGFYEKLEPAKMTKDRQITILRKYIEVLQKYLRDSRLAEMVARNEARATMGLPPLDLEVSDDEWVFSGDIK